MRERLTVMVAVLLPAASVMLPFATALPCHQAQNTVMYLRLQHKRVQASLELDSHRITDQQQQRKGKLTESVMPPAGEPICGVMVYPNVTAFADE